MTEPVVRVPFWKQSRVLGIAGVVVAVLLVIFGVLQLLRSPVDNVKWGYLAWPLPASGSKEPLFPDRHPDRETLSQALQWIQDAKEVKDQNLQFPRRSEQLAIVMKDGQEFTVDMASTCRSTGPNSSTCSTVDNFVTIQDSKRKPQLFFAKSPELYRLLQVAVRNHKPFKEADYPNHVQVGGSFDIVGDGWLTDKVTVTLKQWNTVFWTGETVPDHGHISIKVKCPPKAKPGDYQLEIAGVDWFGIGGIVTIDKQ